MLHPGVAVTTHENVVDNMVTEYGVAELRGRPVAARRRRTIHLNRVTCQLFPPWS